MKEKIESLLTEGINQETKDIDRVSLIEKLKMINNEDKKVAFEVEKVLPQIEKAVKISVASLKNGGKIVYIGAGTSGRLGVVDASEILPTFGTNEAFHAIMAGGAKAFTEPVEDAEDSISNAKADVDKMMITNKDTVIGITASGRTPYVISALERAKEIGARTASVSNVPDSAISKVADVSIEVATGPESVSGSTRMKAGTAQKMVLNMISTAAMIEMGKVYHNFMVDVVATNEKLVERSIKMIQKATGITYHEADNYYEASGRIPRIAIYMALKGSTKEEAIKRLDEADGQLYKALGEENK